MGMLFASRYSIILVAAHVAQVRLSRPFGIDQSETIFRSSMPLQALGIVRPQERRLHHTIYSRLKEAPLAAEAYMCTVKVRADASM